jgi:hypothetical protein
MHLREELGDDTGVGGGAGTGPGEVQLDAIAGTQNDRLAAVARGQLVEGDG